MASDLTHFTPQLPDWFRVWVQHAYEAPGRRELKRANTLVAVLSSSIGVDREEQSCEIGQRDIRPVGSVGTGSTAGG